MKNSKSVTSVILSLLLLGSQTAISSDSLIRPSSPVPVLANIQLPAGFKASVIADGLGGARHIAVASNGDVFVKLSRLKDGKGIIRLRDANKDDSYEQQTGFGNYPGTGIYVRSGYLYASSNTEVYRYKLDEKGEVMHMEEPELLVTGLVSHGRDESKSIVVDDKKNLFVTVGSYSNACLDAGSLVGPSPVNYWIQLGVSGNLSPMFKTSHSQLPNDLRQDLKIRLALHGINKRSRCL